MGYDVVHELIITLTANKISVKLIYGSSKTKTLLCERVILGGFLVASKDIMC